MRKLAGFFVVLSLLFACNGNDKGQNKSTVGFDSSKVATWDTIYGGADKAYDTTLLSLRAKIAPQFKTFEFKDEETGRTMAYDIFIPRDYDANKSYPLVQFIADASTVGRGPESPLMQGYGAIIWATEESQKDNPAIVLVPTFKGPEWAVNDEWDTSVEVGIAYRLLQDIIATYNVDENRIYTTGQSMGGMISFYFNANHPKLFAASIFVSSQWDINVLEPLVNETFFYIVSAGDDKASMGMKEVGELLTRNNVKYGFTEFSAQLPIDQQNADIDKILKEDHKVNFVKFTKGSVLPKGVTEKSGAEHMYSFDYAYRLKSVRDWLFKQKKNN